MADRPWCIRLARSYDGRKQPRGRMLQEGRGAWIRTCLTRSLRRSLRAGPSWLWSRRSSPTGCRGRASLDEQWQPEDVLPRAGKRACNLMGVLHGRVTVGLSTDELRELSLDDNAIKCSIQDLPVAMAPRGAAPAARRVAATAFLAHRAGINVFPTGFETRRYAHRGACPRRTTLIRRHSSPSRRSRSSWCRAA